MSCFSDCPYAQALAWLEDKNTLHKSVEIAYVVDGYEVNMMTGDIGVPQQTFHGETLLDAINKAKEVFPIGQATSKHMH